MANSRKQVRWLENGWPSPSGAPNYRLDPDLGFDKPLLRAVLDYWNGIRGERRMPSRRDLNPADLPRDAVSSVAMTDILREPHLRFRWRLLGTEITRRAERDSTGKYWDEVYDPETLEWFSTATRWLVENRRPVRFVCTFPIEGKSFITMETVELPFSDDGEQVNMTMAVVIMD